MITMASSAIKKCIVLITVVTTLLGATTFVGAPVASAKDLSDDFASFVDGMFQDDGTGVVTFTDFQGGLKPPTPEGYDSSLTQVKSGREFVVKVVNYALGFLGLFAVLIVIYGGFLYLSSGGESDGPEKGKKAIMYAIIGILIIFASYAIVNTVLKAPGGNQAAQPNGVTPGAQFANGPQFGRNVQATRVYNLTTYVIRAYQNYAASRLALEDMNQNIDKFWNENTFQTENDATSAINQIENNYTPIADTLQSIAGRSTDFTALADMTEYQRLYVKGWIQDRRDEVSKIQSTPVNLGSVKTNLSKDEEWIMSKAGGQLAQNCYEDSPLTQPSTAVCIEGRFKQYRDYFANRYAEFIKTLQSGVYKIDASEVGIGVNQIQNQLDKDFEAQMDFAKAELLSIQSSSKSWPDQATGYFNELSGKGNVSATISSTQNIFTKLNADKKNPIEAKKDLKAAVVALSKLYETLKDLQGVNVKLTANVRQGNAPLIVTFSTVGSVDPSNKSINDAQVSWDLDGDGDFGKNAIECKEEHTSTATCVYKKPGTYRVGVKIASQSPDVVEGIEYIDVKVNPPRARFSIQLITSQNNTQTVIPITDYDKDGLMKIDRNRVQLAYSDISKGLKFSAVGTVSGDIIDKNDKNIDIGKKTQETIQRMRWVFGDGTSVDDSPAENPSIMQVDHVYTQRGTYQVLLEVTGKDGVVDRKIFYVTVADISAIIYVVPGYTNKVSTPITFKSAVTSDGSKISGYEWTSTPDKAEFVSKDPSFSAAPDKPGRYTISLKVKNESNSEATDKVDIDIESNPPVAKFSVKIPKASQPAEVELNGSESYDPDGPNPSILYTWTIGGEVGKDFVYTKGTENDRNIRVRFLTTGERKVELKVEDSNEKGKTTKASQNVKINSLLGADWTTTTQSSAVLNSNGMAAVSLGIASSNATSYSFDYGDGEVEDGVFAGTQGIDTKHTYTRAGIFNVSASVQDDEGNTVKLSKKIAIGGGKNPVAASSVLINNEEADTTQIITASRKDVFTFSAANAKNLDGTTKNLDYSWDFGDGKKSTKSVVSYSYKDVSPKVPGYYIVTLTVSDKTDPTKVSSESFKISIVPQKPTLKTITVIPLAAEYKTPLKVQLKAVEARAPEGQITTYRWWYYDVKDNTNELGSQITTVPDTTINLGTKGEEGAEVTYAFQVELRDNMNQVVTATDILGENNLPTLKVVNGPNKPPKASFTVSKTSVGTGEAITFTSTSTDSDGKIASYVWDLDGDGFQNDQSGTKSSMTKTYTTPATQGIKIRLKVVDDSYAESVSEPLTIFVTSKYEAPKAAFYYQQKAGTLQVTFQNAATADKLLTIEKNTWDFDTTSSQKTSDSNGDGVKDNDTDSSEKSPIATYAAAGTYYAKLTVKDSSGAETSLINPVVVKPVGSTPGTSGPGSVPTFSLPLNAKMNTIPAADPMDGKIHLTGIAGNVTIDMSPSEGSIKKYVIDKNIYFDSNSDGIKDNDENFTSVNPTQWTTDFQKAWGKDAFKLTVYDANGKTSSVIREVMFDAPLASGANNIFVVPGAYELYASLASMFGFGILSYRNKKRKNTQA